MNDFFQNKKHGFGALIFVLFCFFPLASAVAQEEASAGKEQGPEGFILPDPISATATRSPMESFEYPGMVTAIGK